MRKLVSLGVFALTLACSPCRAVTIHVERSPEGPSLVLVSGTFEYGDQQQFVTEVLTLREAIVVFASSGGNPFAAIEIGQAIRMKGFVTVVPENTSCASACALAWLGGRTRVMSEKAKVGFHAAYKLAGDKPVEVGAFNAAIGAYLNSLGLSQGAVLFITARPPQEMAWLTFDDAMKYGIEVKRLETLLALEAPAPLPLRPPKQLPQDVTEPPTTGSIGPAPRFRVPEKTPLDLSRVESAAEVQRRLQERGFFVGIVDGIWGPRSRIALREFKLHNGLAASDRWDMEAQTKLFGDGRRAPIGYEPPHPFTEFPGLYKPFAPVGTRLHPLNAADALSIQTRLQQYGYYEGPGDGIWGFPSRAALREFKIASGLAPDDVWDTRTEAMLMVEPGRAAPPPGIGMTAGHR